ncbi:hypothetical protein K466DRAFT_523514 [Polyporus arcularius HHB13444]|uniref:DUF7719 domain-containing protein n=1 Tax=Polyporus arcularius HHB13444 TaxID=1314778 RepID=A0A5C3PC05_9APHY|nr:hypothetical protein K466DRAFT_523514 [Polyporus arcularius HHB13444]
MARNRKNVSSAKKQDTIDIPEDEQWRIINESGILKQIPREWNPSRPADQGQEVTQGAEGDEEGLSPFAEEVFSAAMLTIPMSFMLLMMEILVHYQYGRRPEMSELMDRMLPGVPIISIFVFYTNRYKFDIRVQTALFLLASIGGSRLVWLINRGNWLKVIQQSPPLATAWIFAVVELNLLPAFLSLVAVTGYSWYAGLKLVP